MDRVELPEPDVKEPPPPPDPADSPHAIVDPGPERFAVEEAPKAGERLQPDSGEPRPAKPTKPKDERPRDEHGRFKGESPIGEDLRERAKLLGFDDEFIDGFDSEKSLRHTVKVAQTRLMQQRSQKQARPAEPGKPGQEPAPKKFDLGMKDGDWDPDLKKILTGLAERYETKLEELTARLSRFEAPTGETPDARTPTGGDPKVRASLETAWAQLANEFGDELGSGDSDNVTDEQLESRRDHAYTMDAIQRQRKRHGETPLDTNELAREAAMRLFNRHKAGVREEMRRALRERSHNVTSSFNGRGAGPVGASANNPDAAALEFVAQHIRKHG